jgi:hypothetical protein
MHLLIFFGAIFLFHERQYSLSFFNGQLISAWVLKRDRQMDAQWLPNRHLQSTPHNFSDRTRSVERDLEWG